MKHAVIILAHKDYSFLCRLVNYFTNDCELFIHVDKKSVITPKEINQLSAYSQVKYVCQKYAVHWGGFTMLKTELYMLRLAMKLSTVDYFHLLSGQDYPVKPLKLFLSYFEKNKGRSFLDFNHIPFFERDGNTNIRFQYYMPYDFIDGKSSKGQKLLYKVSLWHEKLCLKRRIPDHFSHLYGGSQWFSVTREAISVLLNYTHRKPSFYRRMRFTFAPEESYVATVIVNNMPKSRLVNNNLRYIRWQNENGSYPANLGEEHFADIVKKNIFFVRKMASPFCIPLMKKIDKYLLSEIDFMVGATGVWHCRSFNLFRFDSSLADAVIEFCKLMEINSVVDVGCGCGTYVEALKNSDVPVVGFDGNPYTLELIHVLYSEGLPCTIADITDMQVGNGVSFELVICIDVLTYINGGFEERAIINLVKMSRKYILLTWKPKRKTDNDKDLTLQDEDYIVALLCQCGFRLKKAWTEHFRTVSEILDYQNTLLLFENIKV